MNPYPTPTGVYPNCASTSSTRDSGPCKFTKNINFKISAHIMRRLPNVDNPEL